jgi:AraC-like DNA-binding protein
MASVAAQFGLRRQTLLRRLRREGADFAQVLTDLRRRVAEECPREGLSVSETAYRVGHSDPAPFSRAFKRWTGASPRSFVVTRRKHTGQ